MHELTPPCEVPFPPWLARLLPDLSNAALRVSLVVLHESAGWEAESAILSRADLASLSGLAPSSVQLGIEEALKRQLLQRARVGIGYAYRLKAPSDTSAFPAAPSRNVTALRQLQRVQQRLTESTEFERATLERGPCSSFNAAAHPPVNEADRRAGGTNDYLVTHPDQQAVKSSVANNTTDRASVTANDRGSVLSLDLDHVSVEVADRSAVTLGVLDRRVVEEADRSTSQTGRLAVGVDRKAVSTLTEIPSTTGPNGSSGVDQLPVNIPVNDCEQSRFSPSCAPVSAGAQWKNINNLFIPKHTHPVCKESVSEIPARESARVTTHLSVFSYGEVLAYAQSLKGIRNPGGLAVVYWRSGEMDGEVANFQRRQSEIAQRQAAEAAVQAADMREMARNMLARGEPLAEWEREFIAACAEPLQEEHDIQIQRLDAAHCSVV